MAVAVRPMTARDVPAVVQLQRTFLVGSLVTELGPAFLDRFHRVGLEHAATRAFVAVDEQGALSGFVIGTIDVHQFNQQVKPRVVAPLALAIVHPARLRLIPSIVRSVFEAEPQPPIPAELLLLVVDARTRRGGIGRALLGELERAFAAEGIGRYRVAVRSQLNVARAFYGALAFEFEQELQVLGQPMTYLTKRVGAAG